MAISLPYSGYSTEVSFMDWPMCACSVLELRQEGAEQQVLEITATVFLAQFSASIGFACLYRLVESGCYRVRALIYR